MMEISGFKLYHNLNVSYWTKSEFDTDMKEQFVIKSYDLDCPVLKVLLYINSEQDRSSEVLLFSFDFGENFSYMKYILLLSYS
jgi:hypothetical protein